MMVRGSGGDSSGRPGIQGMVRAVVTNNQDKAGQGRVKVRFLNMPTQIESAWARIGTPMSGKQYGLYFLPEVNDEVLVMFEQGDVDRPFVIGSVWNGVDKPPSQFVNDDGKNDHRVIRSRSGHLLEFDDTENKEQLTVRSGESSIVIDLRSNRITITAAKDLSLEAKGDISLRSDGNVAIKCNGFEVEAKEKISVKAVKALALQCTPGVTINVDGLVVT